MVPGKLGNYRQSNETGPPYLIAQTKIQDLRLVKRDSTKVLQENIQEMFINTYLGHDFWMMPKAQTTKININK